MTKQEIQQIIDDIEFVLNKLLEDINNEKIKEDPQLLDAFLDELKYYQNLLTKDFSQPLF